MNFHHNILCPFHTPKLQMEDSELYALGFGEKRVPLLMDLASNKTQTLLGFSIQDEYLFTHSYLGYIAWCCPNSMSGHSWCIWCCDDETGLEAHGSAAASYWFPAQCLVYFEMRHR